MPDQDSQRRQRRDCDIGAACGAPPPGHVSRLATRHPDELHVWLSARYVANQRRIRPRARGFEYVAESAALGGLVFGRTSCKAATVEVSWPSLPYVGVCHARSGRRLARWHGGEVRVADRETVLCPPGGVMYMDDCLDASGISLSTDSLMRVAEETSGLDRARLRFTSLLPVSPAAERQWLATAEYIQRGIYNLALEHPLVLAAAEQLVAACVLATFPNTTMTSDVHRPRDRARAALVRRAMAFIDSHSARPISVTDIAAAVGVVPRTLQYAFRRHRDITPTAYLRRVRLAQAHNELVAAVPGDGTTVAAVAARWGYARPSGFAAAYREMYGHPPSETLRS